VSEKQDLKPSVVVVFLVHVHRHPDAHAPPQSLTVISPPGDRAAEGRDGPLGQGAAPGGRAGGVRRAAVAVVVQPVRRAQLQEGAAAGARGRPPGAHRGGGRHRDAPLEPLDISELRDFRRHRGGFLNI